MKNAQLPNRAGRVVVSARLPVELASSIRAACEAAGIDRQQFFEDASSLMLATMLQPPRRRGRPTRKAA